MPRIRGGLGCLFQKQNKKGVGCHGCDSGLSQGRGETCPPHPRTPESQRWMCRRWHGALSSPFNICASSHPSGIDDHVTRGARRRRIGVSDVEFRSSSLVVMGGLTCFFGFPFFAELACPSLPRESQIAGCDYWRPCAPAELLASTRSSRTTGWCCTGWNSPPSMLTNGRLQLREVSGAANHDAPLAPPAVMGPIDQKDGERGAGDFLVLGRIPGWEALGTSSHLAVTHQHRPCNWRVHQQVSKWWWWWADPKRGPAAKVGQHGGRSPSRRHGRRLKMVKALFRC